MLAVGGNGSGGLVLGGRAADAYFARLQSIVARPAYGARFSASGDAVRVVPATPGVALDVPRSAVAGARSRRAPAAPGRTPGRGHGQRGRTTVAAVAMGITGLVGSYETRLRRGRQPDPQRRAGRAPDRRQADRARRDLLVQRRHRRAHGRQGLPGRPGDHQRRAFDRARRRRLPGLDDRLQRRLRGGAADHRAYEPRALHLALPAGPRRDRRLPRRRPAFVNDTPALAAPAHVRRALLARRLALR